MSMDLKMTNGTSLVSEEELQEFFNAENILGGVVDQLSQDATFTGPACRLCKREGMKLFLRGDRCYTNKCQLN